MTWTLSPKRAPWGCGPPLPEPGPHGEEHPGEPGSSAVLRRVPRAAVPNAFGFSVRPARPTGKDVTAPEPRVAIAHDYLTQRGGAERVVLAMARAFPEAPIYTTLFDPARTFPEFRGLDVRPSWLNRFTVFREDHRAALPILPMVSSQVCIDADVVIASSSGWAHGFRTPGRKIVYCYSPARWLYQPDRYLGREPATAVRLALAMLSPPLRRWDGRAASSADSFLAISTVVRERIIETYGRSARVVPAPYTLEETRTRDEDGAELPEEGYFLVVSRLLPYKNVDAVIEAFRLRPGRRLVVVGVGPEKAQLIEAAPTNVAFLENLTDAEMSRLYVGAAGLVAASYEDFGLTPLEAASRGKASAVLRWGGFLDTVVEGVTGVFFDEPTPELIADAVDRLAERSWDADVLRARAERFSESAFADSLKAEVQRVYTSGRQDGAPCSAEEAL